MKIAIHHKENDFSSKWIEYCQTHHIDHKIVNCYDNDIIGQLEDCDALMWHFNQSHPRDFLFAKQLIFALQSAGKKVFPDFYTAWHFDDKVGQKYLLEATGAPLVPSYTFYEKQKALDWIEQAEFPKVFKLRRGAGAAHVKLTNSKAEAKSLVGKAFGRGFSQYDKVQNLKDRWYQYRNGKTGLWNVTKGVLRFARTTEFARVAGPERGYIYFQDFIPNCKWDYRMKIVGNRCWGFRRHTRENDFRASGSGLLDFDLDFIPKRLVKICFDITTKIGAQSLALDLIKSEKEFKLVEISYAFGMDEGETDQGYWDSDLNWHEGPFDAQGWMVKTLLKET